MNKEQLLERFEDMTSNSIAMIKEFGTDVERDYLIELNVLVWATRGMTEIKESEMEKIIKRETGFSLYDLVQIENGYYN